jgi:hypothetical protein
MGVQITQILDGWILLTEPFKKVCFVFLIVRAEGPVIDGLPTRWRDVRDDMVVAAYRSEESHSKFAFVFPRKRTDSRVNVAIEHEFFHRSNSCRY